MPESIRMDITKKKSKLFSTIFKWRHKERKKYKSSMLALLVWPSNLKFYVYCHCSRRIRKLNSNGSSNTVLLMCSFNWSYNTAFFYVFIFFKTMDVVRLQKGKADAEVYIHSYPVLVIFVSINKMTIVAEENTNIMF